MKKILIIRNQAAYGADETFNAIRLATRADPTRRHGRHRLPHGGRGDLRDRRSEDPPRLLHPGPDGEDLRPTSRAAGHAWARAASPRNTHRRSARSNMEELAAWTAEADQVLTF